MYTTKFRIWDKVAKRMIVEPSMTFPDHHGFFWQDRPGSRIRSDLEAELMQCIGLHDKNGKEIWEGDILRVDWHDGRYPIHSIGPVAWDTEEARWILGEGGSPSHDAENYMEIIGNCYENPDLLRGEL